jgi:hypothetical protein
MGKSPDFAGMMRDAMGRMPVDTTSMENMMKSQMALAERMSAVAIDAARQSTDLSAKWMQDSLGKLAAMTAAKSEPADYAKSMTDFVTSSAESAAEHMAAFAEIAKRVQTETLELLLAAGKDLSADMTTAARRATADIAAAAQKATSVSTNV